MTLQFWIKNSTCNFVVLDSDMEMYWYAVEQREALEQTYKVARRSCYQRLHEIVRLMERMRQTMKETDVTAKRVADEYKANVASMTENSGSSVTNSFVDAASTVAKRMLSVPEIAFCMAAWMSTMQWPVGQAANSPILLTRTQGCKQSWTSAKRGRQANSLHRGDLVPCEERPREILEHTGPQGHRSDGKQRIYRFIDV